MDKPYGIIVFGANGSGKTTLARILGFKHMDIEDYTFEEAELPYSKPRPRNECISLMLADIEKHGKFVFSTCTGDWGDIIPQYYKFAVFLTAPHGLRMERVKNRTSDKHGERTCEGGDMYEQHQKFFDFVATHPLSKIEQWAQTLTCPIINVDGTMDWRINAEKIVEEFSNYEQKI